MGSTNEGWEESGGDGAGDRCDPGKSSCALGRAEQRQSSGQDRMQRGTNGERAEGNGWQPGSLVGGLPAEVGRTGCRAAAGAWPPRAGWAAMPHLACPLSKPKPKPGRPEAGQDGGKGDWGCPVPALLVVRGRRVSGGDGLLALPQPLRRQQRWLADHILLRAGGARGGRRRSAMHAACRGGQRCPATQAWAGKEAGAAGMNGASRLSLPPLPQAQQVGLQSRHNSNAAQGQPSASSPPPAG